MYECEYTLVWSNRVRMRFKNLDSMQTQFCVNNAVHTTFHAVGIREI